jgi:hypothetical protein
MRPGWLGFIELFVVLMFAIGWGVLELMVLRMERRKARSAGGSEVEGDSGHAKR